MKSIVLMVVMCVLGLFYSVQVVCLLIAAKRGKPSSKLDIFSSLMLAGSCISTLILGLLRDAQ